MSPEGNLTSKGKNIVQRMKEEARKRGLDWSSVSAEPIKLLPILRDVEPEIHAKISQELADLGREDLWGPMLNLMLSKYNEEYRRLN